MASWLAAKARTTKSSAISWLRRDSAGDPSAEIGQISCAFDGDIVALWRRSWAVEELGQMGSEPTRFSLLGSRLPIQPREKLSQKRSITPYQAEILDSNQGISPWQLGEKIFLFLRLFLSPVAAGPSGSDSGGLLADLLEGARRRNLSANSLAAYERIGKVSCAWETFPEEV